MSKTTNEIEKRIAKMARQTAKIICGLRLEGHLEAAKKLEEAAMQAAELMRAGKL